MDLGRSCVVLITAIVLALPATAVAQQTIAPPGKSGADQYFETIPSAKGNVAPPTGGPSSHDQAAAQALARLGKDGRSAAALAAATAPTPAPRHAAHANSAASSRSPFSSFTNVVGGTDEGGIGIFLPILLAAILGLAIAVALSRLRRSDDPV